MASTSLPLTWTPGRLSMTRPSWMSAYHRTTWCVETVRSSTTDTLSASYSSPSQVTNSNLSILTTLWYKKAGCVFCFFSHCGLVVSDTFMHFNVIQPAVMTLLSFSLSRVLCFLCCCQLSPVVLCLVIMSMSFMRFDSTGAKRTREDQSTLSTSRLSRWR